MSALPPIADINPHRLECPLIANSGHQSAQTGTSELCHPRTYFSRLIACLLRCVGRCRTDVPLAEAFPVRNVCQFQSVCVYWNGDRRCYVFLSFPLKWLPHDQIPYATGLTSTIGKGRAPLKSTHFSFSSLSSQSRPPCDIIRYLPHIYAPKSLCCND